MSKCDNCDIWDQTYLSNDPSDLPWNFEEIPEWFKAIIDSKWIKPCKTLDIGCGLGNYANYLASKRFNVLGVDFSHEAIERAQSKYASHLLKFKVGNALELYKLRTKFDFIFEVSLLHHIKPEDRDVYAREIVSVSNKGAKILVCCFSDKESFFEGNKNFNNPETNTVTFPLSSEELTKTFGKYFTIEKVQELAFGKKSSRKRLLMLMSFDN